MADDPGKRAEEQDFLPGFDSVDQFTQGNLRKILQATKLSNDLPGEKRSDYDYYSTFSGFRTVMKSEEARLRDMVKKQLAFHGIHSGVVGNHVDDLVELLTETNDAILERINMNLDEAAGISRDVNPLLLEVSQSNVNRVSGSWNNFDRRSRAGEKQPGEVKLLTAKNILRPQVKFKQFIDNTNSPFIPRMTEKPHASKPLSILVEYDDSGHEFYSHPYLFELERLKPLPAQLESSEPVRPAPVEKVNLTYVNSSEKLDSAIQHLSREQVIAVDLEAHSYRSFQGITCLIQISSHSEDFIIDPFEVWGDLTRLNEITANPNIVKVLHGSDKDIEWLQRDFSVYLVNVFDTHQAGKLLGLPRLSLAWLLENYCGVMADKQYQLADWRIRPIPDEMLYYARQDTRYLIYIYNRLKNELLTKGNDQKNLLLAALHQSNDLCKKRYLKPLLHSESHLDLLRKSKAVLNNKQMFALQEVFAWRDKIGRTEDESTAYVLPNHMLLKICTELPREMQGILACCNPVPPLVKQNLQAMHMIIFNARNKPLQTVDADINTNTQNLNEVVVGNEELFNEDPLKCPLDLSNSGDQVTELVTLVDKHVNRIKGFQVTVNGNFVKKYPDMRVLAAKTSKTKPGQRKKTDSGFVSPFQRYQLLKPFLESLKKEEENLQNQQPEKISQPNADLRIESIKLHFEKLTQMTPSAKKTSKQEEEEEEEEITEIEKAGDDESDDNGEVLPFPSRKDQAVNIKSFRGKKKKNEEVPESQETAVRKAEIEKKLKESEEASRAAKKRKSEDPGGEAAAADSKVPRTEIATQQLKQQGFDYSAVNYGQLFSKGQQNRSDFNPHRGGDKKDNSKFGKQKQRMKNGGKSVTYNKK